MKVALVGAIDFNQEHFKSMDFDLVVAVDAGWKSCQSAGVMPNFAIGDFDSLGYTPEGVEVISFPCQKNESDLELAFLESHKRSADELYFYGVLGARLDHTLATLQVMTASALRGIKTFAIGPDYAVAALSSASKLNTLGFDAFDPGVLSGSYAPHISLMAFTGTVQGLSVEGLAYTVENYRLDSCNADGFSDDAVFRLCRHARRAEYDGRQLHVKLLYFGKTAGDL